MYKIGDYIIYGSIGVCRVDKVGTIEALGISKDRIYYTLSPVYTKGSTIFTPADNKKVIIRSLLTKEEALQLIDDMKEITTLWIPDEKTREQEYKQVFRKCDCSELVKIIKTIYYRKQSRISEGKKISSYDEKYFNMAEDCLYGELAISLGMEK